MFEWYWWVGGIRFAIPPYAFDNDAKVKAPFDGKRLIEKLELNEGLAPFTWQGEPRPYQPTPYV